MPRPLLLLLLLLLLAGCIEIPIFSAETVRTPQPRPACGETGRAYAPPPPGPVSAPAAPAAIATAPASVPR